MKRKIPDVSKITTEISDEFIERFSAKNPIFKKVFERLNYDKLTEEERELYHSDAKAKSDWNAGIRYAAEKAKAEGKKEGEHKKALEIAIEMKKEGLPIEQIIKITKLSAKEIEALR